MDTYLEAKKLFDSLNDMDPDLPNLVMAILQVCDHCDCGLREGLTNGDKATVAKAIRLKAESCYHPVALSVHRVSRSPVVALALSKGQGKPLAMRRINDGKALAATAAIGKTTLSG